MLVYAKAQHYLRQESTIWREEKPGARDIWEHYLTLRKAHGDDDAIIEAELQKWFSELPKSHAAKKWSRYKRVDANGPWRDRDISSPGGEGHKYDVIHPKTKKPCRVPDRGWAYSNILEMQRQIDLGLVAFREDHTEPPFRKAHIRPIAQELDAVPEGDADEGGENELATQVRGSYFYKQSQVSVRHLRELLGKNVFNNPKDVDEVARLLGYVSPSDKETITLDFFAGSGTTGEAVMRLNAEDGGQRQFILVQIPQPIDAKKQKEAHDFVKQTLGKPEATIFEITAERLRRAGDKINAEQVKLGKPEVDTGFRVYELADDPHALVHRTRLDAATQDDVAALQSAIATPQPEQRPVVLANLLLTEGLPLSATLTPLAAGGVSDALWQAQDTLFVLGSVPLDALTDLLRQRKAAGTPVAHVSVYAPWVHDDNFLQGVQTLLQAEGYSADRLRLRG
jgi:adenine-specific DNA-methyltransferase